MIRHDEALRPGPVGAGLCGAAALLVGSGVAAVVSGWIGSPDPPSGVAAVLAGVVVVLAVGAALGLLGWRRPYGTEAGIAALTVLVIVLVPVAGRGSLPLGAVGPLVGAVIALVAHWSLSAAVGLVEHRGVAAALDPDRRRLLIAGGLAVTVVAALGAAGVSLLGGGRPGSGSSAAGSGADADDPDAGTLGPAPTVPTGPTTDGASGPPLLRGPVFDVRTLGARADGTTDDAPAIRAALDAAEPVRGTVYLPAGRYYVRSAPTFTPAAGVTLAGDPGRTTVLVDAADPGAYTEFCRPSGDDVTVDGLIVERAAGNPTVLFPLGAVNRFTLSRTRLVGHMDTLAGAYCHGLQLGVADGSSGGYRLLASRFETLTYGLFQTNDSAAAVTGFEVTDCTFSRNTSTDLEFNAPGGALRGVRVAGCRFDDKGPGGFGVGFALVNDAAVRDCLFTDFAVEAVHVEDYSNGVVVDGNLFTDCGRTGAAAVQILSGAQGVRLTGNTFRTGGDTVPVPCVNVTAGGDGTTGSGRDIIPPHDVTVRGNAFDLAAPVRAVAMSEVPDATITDNRVTGAGAQPGDTIGAARVFTLEASSVRVSVNEVAGVLY